MVERVVALVDGDAILLSDLRRARSLLQDQEVSDRTILERLIDERVRLHEIERFDALPVPLEQVDEQVALLRERLGGEAALQRELDAAQWSMEELRQTFSRQLLILGYVEERLGARVFVDLDDVREYFDAVLRPRLEQEGAEVPELAKVQEEIRALLREQRLDEEIRRWTGELRARADIRDLLEEEPAPPSPGAGQPPQ